MHTDGENSLCTVCTGKNCETGQCQCQQCHGSLRPAGLERHSPGNQQHGGDNVVRHADLTHGSGEGSSATPLLNNDREARDKVRPSDKDDVSFGFEAEDDERTAHCGAGAMSSKEPAAAPVYYGEVTPEEPGRRRTKPTTPAAGQDGRPSPPVVVAAHAHAHGSADPCGRQEQSVHGHGHGHGQGHAPGHHQGNMLRSDAYLRQALTSPYNQRGGGGGGGGGAAGEKHLMAAVNSSSPCGSKEGSPWLERGARQGLLEGYRQWAGEHLETAAAGSGHEHLVIFKTPLKSIRRAMFCSPDGARHGERGAISGGSSPSSSASSSSGGGTHGSGHQHNPFELGEDRLHFPTFSPNMFNMSQTAGSSEEKFQWNIEHLAELRPVHIDEKDIKRQMSKQRLDEEAEKRAQKAIDYYFQHHMVAPSPWSDAPPPHVLPTTPCGPSYEDLLAATPNQAQGSIQKDLPRSKKGADKSCQTTLTLPLSLDLEKLLGEYMTYQDTDRDESIGSISSSSLRRKLFFNADSSFTLSPVKSGQKSPDHLAAAMSTPPQWERGSPMLTPSSVQFSSSPIRGELHGEGDYFMSSFSEHGPLASPQLSPIADKRRGRFRQSLGFPSLEDNADLEFGSPVQKQLQMEVHDGSSPRGRPSPDVSPIAAFGSGGSGHHSRSRTLRAEADMSHSIFSPPLHPHPAFSSPSLQGPASSAFPSLRAARATSQRVSISMDTDAASAEFLTSKDAGVLTPRDASMTEETLGGEGGSSGLDIDTLQHPSSASYPDTGYQTGSGNGSLQTTQEGAVSMTTNTSTDAPTTSTSLTLDSTGAQLRKVLTTRLQQQTWGEPGWAGPTTDVKTASRLSADDNNSVDGLGASTSVDSGLVAHSNLTSQFMNLPSLYASELSLDSADSNSSLQPHALAARRASEKLSTSSSYSNFEDLLKVRQESGGSSSRDLLPPLGSDLSSSAGQIFPSKRAVSVDPPDSVQQEKKVSDNRPPVDGFSSGGTGRLFAVGLKGSVCVDRPDFVQGGQDAAAAKGAAQRLASSQSDGDLSEDDHELTADSYIYRRDPDFLNRMGEYLLRKGGELSSDEDVAGHKGGGGGGEEENSAPAPTTTTTTTTLPPSPALSSTFADAGPDDSVLERAREYLASVNYPQGVDKMTGMETTGASSSSPLTALDLVPLAGLSTPAKRLLGRVAGDLTSGGRDNPGSSPALASDVAQELIRRAEMDLKRLRYPRSNSKSGSS